MPGARWSASAPIVAALVAVILGLAGCGGGGAPRTAAQPAAARPAGAPNRCVAAPRDLAASGPYAVRHAAVAMRRYSGASRSSRAIDPQVWYPARSPRGCRLPLILFSHGHNGSAAAYSRLCAHLASLGFAVLAPLHADRETARNLQGPERVEDLSYLRAAPTPSILPG